MEGLWSGLMSLDWLSWLLLWFPILYLQLDVKMDLKTNGIINYDSIYRGEYICVHVLI